MSSAIYFCWQANSFFVDCEVAIAWAKLFLFLKILPCIPGFEERVLKSTQPTCLGISQRRRTDGAEDWQHFPTEPPLESEEEPDSKTKDASGDEPKCSPEEASFLVALIAVFLREDICKVKSMMCCALKVKDLYLGAHYSRFLREFAIEHGYERSRSPKRFPMHPRQLLEWEETRFSFFLAMPILHRSYKKNVTSGLLDANSWFRINASNAARNNCVNGNVVWNKWSESFAVRVPKPVCL